MISSANLRQKRLEKHRSSEWMEEHFLNSRRLSRTREGLLELRKFSPRLFDFEASLDEMEFREFRDALTRARVHAKATAKTEKTGILADLAGSRTREALGNLGEFAQFAQALTRAQPQNASARLIF